MTRSMEKEGVLSMRKFQCHICPIKFYWLLIFCYTIGETWKA